MSPSASSRSAGSRPCGPALIVWPLGHASGAMPWGAMPGGVAARSRRAGRGRSAEQQHSSSPPNLPEPPPREKPGPMCMIGILDRGAPSDHRVVQYRLPPSIDLDACASAFRGIAPASARVPGSFASSSSIAEDGWAGGVLSVADPRRRRGVLLRPLDRPASASAMAWTRRSSISTPPASPTLG